MRDVQIDSIRAVDRTIDVLNVFTHHTPVLTIDEITKAANLPKTTVYRILYTLEQRGLIRYNPNLQKYQLGYKFLVYGDLVSSSLDLRQEAEEELLKLYDCTRQTVLLAIREGDDVIYIFSKENPEGLKVALFEGPKRPLVYGAFGYVLMAFLNPHRLSQIFMNPIPQFTPATVVDKELVMRRLEQLRQQKFWIETNEAILGVTGIAAPVFDANDKVIAAVGINGPAVQLVGDQLE